MFDLVWLAGLTRYVFETLPLTLAPRCVLVAYLYVLNSIA